MSAQLDKYPWAMGGNDPERKRDVPDPGVGLHQPGRAQQARLEEELAHLHCGLG